MGAAWRLHAWTDSKFNGILKVHAHQDQIDVCCLWEPPVSNLEGWFAKVEAISKQEADNPEARRGVGEDNFSRCHRDLTLYMAFMLPAGYDRALLVWEPRKHLIALFLLTCQTEAREECVQTHLSGQSQLTKLNPGLPRYGTRSAHLSPGVSP